MTDRSGADDEQRYCSRVCASEPMLGTSDEVNVWICLEYRPVWRAKALVDNALTPEVREWLDRAMAVVRAAGLKPRLQFIRRPEIDSDSTHLLIANGARMWRFDGIGYGFLDAVDLPAVIRGEGAFDEAPVYLVCTNGQRDLCCARYGLPAYRALREVAGERVWQTSHLGGHRFAPNVLTLPDGVMYGRVEPEAVPAFAGAVESGAVHWPLLRGRSCYSKPVQAAEGFLSRERLRFESLRPREHSMRVAFRDSAGNGHNVCVAPSAEPVQALASCGDAERKPVYPYRRVDVGSSSA